MSNVTRERKPTTPGEMLQKEFLEPAGITQKKFAEYIGVDNKTVNRLVNGHTRLGPKMARFLASAFGTTPEFWMKLQNDVDLFKAGKEDPELPGMLPEVEEDFEDAPEWLDVPA